MNDTPTGCPGTNRHGEPCGHPEGWGTENDSGPCKHHGGAGGSSEKHEGNDWAATHGAYAESFIEDFLTDKEKERVNQLREVLESPEGAREDAKLMVGILKEQFRRSGDERFIRRYESICDTFNIAPEDEMNLNLDANHSGQLELTINREVVKDDND